MTMRVLGYNFNFYRITTVNYKVFSPNEYAF